MLKALRVLKRRLAELRERGPNRDLTEPIMVQVRQVLEQRSYRNDFVQLHLMCHWVVHASLHDSALIYKWLTATTASVRGLFTGDGSVADNTKAGATVLDLDGLRMQLRELLRRETVDLLIADDDMCWYQFLQGLLGCIYENPIGVPDAPPAAKSHAAKYLAQYRQPDRPWLECIKRIEVFVKDDRFKVKLDTMGRFAHIFTVASANPFCEYDSFGLPETEWAKTTDIWLGRPPRSDALTDAAP